MEFVATIEELGEFVSRRIGEFSGFLWQPRTFTNILICFGATILGFVFSAMLGRCTVIPVASRPTMAAAPGRMRANALFGKSRPACSGALRVA